MDANACNFNPEATIPTDDCTLPEPFYNCEGTCENDIDGDGICDEMEIAGCNDIDACNYVENVTDEGACDYAEEHYDCDGNCLNDTNGNGVCDELEGSTIDVGDIDAQPELKAYPNPMGPEHAMVFLSGVNDEQTPIRGLRHRWTRGLARHRHLSSPRRGRVSHQRVHFTRHLLHPSGDLHSIRKHPIDGLVIGFGSARNH